MRKLICLITALVMCLSLAAPAYAAESDFVPSITYKADPEIVPVKNEAGEECIGVIRDANGEIIDYVDHGCLDVTPVAHVWDDTKEVPAEVKQLLTFVYEGLTEGELEIPYDKFEASLDAANMVIRDLFDARWVCDEHGKMIEDAGITFEITFDLGVAADVEVYAMTYAEDTKEWSPVVKTVNNGDGTVTCTFEHLCAIAFSVPMAPATAPTDDAPSADMLPWIIVLIVAVVAVVVFLASKKKKKSAA